MGERVGYGLRTARARVARKLGELPRIASPLHFEAAGSGDGKLRISIVRYREAKPRATVA